MAALAAFPSHDEAVIYAGRARQDTEALLDTLLHPHLVFIPGRADILVVAPHARTARPRDDVNTGLLARSIAQRLGCAALINERISRKTLDYNRISQARADRSFMARLDRAADDGASVFVWIHGIGEMRLAAEHRAMGISGRLDGLVGFGQPDRFTAREGMWTRLSRVRKKRASSSGRPGVMRGSSGEERRTT